MLVTVLGISTLFNDVQPEQSELPIFPTPSGITTFVIDEYAFGKIVDSLEEHTTCGIATSRNPLHPENAEVPTYETPTGIAILRIPPQL
jgi:hypothetical protein